MSSWKVTKNAYVIKTWMISFPKAVLVKNVQESFIDIKKQCESVTVCVRENKAVSLSTRRIQLCKNWRAISSSSKS